METRINVDAMYDTATAGQLMGGINSRDVCEMINAGMIRGYKRPPVRSKHGVGKGTRSFFVVRGDEILRFNQSMEPAKKLSDLEASALASPRRRGRQTRATKIPEAY